MSDFLWPPWITARQASLSTINSWSLLKLVSIKSVMPFNHLTLCHPLLLLPSIFPSIRVFSSESVLRIRWSKYWSFSFSISLSNEYSGLISFMIDRFDLFYDWQVWFPCSPRDSQESSPTQQFIAINSLVLSFLNGPTLKSIHDYWKNHSSDNMAQSVLDIQENKSWIVIWKTDDEAEASILWPPNAKSWLRKDPDAGKD